MIDIVAPIHFHALTPHPQSDFMERHSLCGAARWRPSLHAARAIVIAIFFGGRYDY